jgi:hypothetical protein
MSVVAGLAHHGDDLLHGRWVGGIEPSLVAGAADRRGSPAVSRASDAARRCRALVRPSWDPPPNRTADRTRCVPALASLSAIIPRMTLSLGPGEAGAGWSLTRRPSLVQGGRLPNVSETPSCHPERALRQHTSGCGLGGTLLTARAVSPRPSEVQGEARQETRCPRGLARELARRLPGRPEVCAKRASRAPAGESRRR